MEKCKCKCKCQCPHCEFIFKTFEMGNEKEYYLMTEVFVYLHNGKDYCNYNKEND